MNKAIVTITIGENYEKMFNNFCRNNWEEYCKKYKYDLIVINQHLDDSKRARERSPAWQKLLILSQEWSNNYDQIVWIDSDVVINNKRAKDIASQVYMNKVGAVDAYSIPTKQLHYVSTIRQYNQFKKNNINYIENLNPGQYYKKRGIPGGDLNKVVQTGVFVCSPNHHREIFERIYYEYEDVNKKASWNYEMPAMSYELIRSNIVQWIPNEYNYTVFNLISAYYSFIFDINTLTRSRKLINYLINKLRLRKNNFLSAIQSRCLKQIYDNGYFIHFAGCQAWIKELDKT